VKNIQAVKSFNLKIWSPWSFLYKIYRLSE